MNSPPPTVLWEELYGYWRAKHVGGRPPSRADIDPMIDLPQIASSLVIIELRPEGLQYRLVGSGVVNHYGVDYTGKKVGTSPVDKIQVTAWRLAVEAAARGEGPRLLASRYPGGKKAHAIALVMPLTPDSDGVLKLLGATFFDQPFPNVDAYPEINFQEVLMGV